MNSISGMYLTPTENHWAADIEADNLLESAKTIWCLCLENVLLPEKKSTFTNGDDFRRWMKENPDAVFVGHNFIAYDAPMLNRHWGARIPIGKIVDTFVLSQLYNPTLAGGHSLDMWGKRLRFPKMEFNDFSRYSEDMLSYCANDTALTARLYVKLAARMRQFNFSETGCDIEHRAWNIIQNKQRRNGFPFDYKRAQKLYVSLRAREEELKDIIYRLWPPQLLVVDSFKKARKANGEFTALYERHLEQYPKLVLRDDGGYDAYDWVSFNLGSPAQRIQKLLELGWQPVNRTKKGNPKVDEDELIAFAEESGKEEIKALAKWIVINSRANMIGTWLNAYNEKTKAIHGKLFIASTLRYRHSDPNSANIPAVRLKKIDDNDVIQYGEDGAYTYECRDLWTCGDSREWSLVGIDGKGIQLRVLANYAYSEEFAARVLSGDPHTNNIKILGLANKAAAKKFLYTTLMGGGGAKLAVDQAQFGTKLTTEDGNRLKKMLIDSIPGFGALIRRLEKELEATGRITLCDGTPVIVPSPHMVIPYLLQGDESRLMKKALIFVDEEIRRHGLHKSVLKVADIHDEWQWRVRNEVVEEFTALALPCFKRSGEFFNYQIPIEGDVKVGKTWAETH